MIACMSRGVVVVKVGSSTLVNERGRARPRVFARIAEDVAAQAGGGTRVVLVSSGAIALGLGSLGRAARPRRLAELQAASAVGQPLLQRRWERALHRHSIQTAQVLLTAGDIHRRDTYLNARRTLENLLRWGSVPVVNENDSTATDEITFGDNDALAAQVALMLGARLLVLLSDVEGLYDRSPGTPGARVIAEVRDHRLLDQLEGPARRGWGSGGIRSKVLAAEMASAGGIQSVIAHGGRPGVLSAAVAGEPVGTRLHASPSPLPAFKLWLRYGKPVRGRLTVDAGARRAVEEQGTSLLPVGLTAVDGRFDAGDAVELVEQGGPPFAVGLAGQAAGDLRRLAGARGAGEAVHRDNLVLLWR